MVILNKKSAFDFETRSSDSMTDKYLVHARESRLHFAIIPVFVNDEAFKLLSISAIISKNPLFHSFKSFTLKHKICLFLPNNYTKIHQNGLWQKYTGGPPFEEFGWFR